MQSMLYNLSAGANRVARPPCTKVGRIATRAVASTLASPSTRVRYSKRPQEGNIFFYTTEPPAEVGKVTNLQPDEVPVELQDLRVSGGTTLERNGFELVNFPSGRGVDWQHNQQVKLVYYPEVESLLKGVTGAKKVVVMSHGLRRGKVSNDPESARQMPALEDPGTLVHVDYTEISAREVLKHYLKDEAEELSNKPWGIIQVWRPLVGPVQHSPLGLLDAATFAQEDAISVDVHVSPAREAVAGQIHKTTFVAHSSKHRWFYTSQMQTDEAYVFVNYDSRTDGRARFTPHGAVADPTLPENVPERRSIEARALVFWE